MSVVRVLDHAKKHKRKATCLACAEKGFSPRDTMAYPCLECGLRGHLKFQRAKLDEYKRRRSSLVCTDCTHRHQSIEERLKDKRALRCTCRGQQRSYANEKCQLFPERAGEKPWPGSNVEVSREDWQLCERMRATKRRKAEDEAL